MGIIHDGVPVSPNDEFCLGDALFAKVQQRVLGILLGNPDRSFYGNEIIRLARSGTGAVQRELRRLEAGGLVIVSRIGNQKHFRANPATPIFEELRTLILKTSGLADVLRSALAPIAADIHAAFAYGSIARGEDTASRDIDLMVISDMVTYQYLYATIEDAAGHLNRTINLTIYTRNELARRVNRNNSLAAIVAAQPKIWLIGEDDGFAS
jgi:predicted nucleotidyltransferase